MANGKVRRVTRDVLYKLYWEEGHSASEVAEILGITKTCVLRNMGNYSIRRRTREEYEDARREKISRSKRGVLPGRRTSVVRIWSNTQKEILDGLILGDGNIHKKAGKKSVYIFQLSCKHKEFCDHVISVLPRELFPISQPYEVVRVRSGKEYKWYNIASRHDDYIAEQYSRWYPNGTKCIPSDLVITPTVLKYWYLGDGSYSSRIVSIRCMSFAKEDIDEIVLPQLHKMGLPFKYWSSGSIGLRKRYGWRFFEIIGGCPVDCYRYKWG